jgi:hypothetical protein
MEDLFDKRILEAFNDVAEIIYDKIPPKFTSIDTWPKSTNLKCWNCDCNFLTVPIFIPVCIETNDLKSMTGSMDTQGNFGSWNCASRYINIHFESSKRWERHEFLKILYSVFTGDDISDILPANPKTIMKQYGGDITPHEYREHLNSMNEKHKTALKHNSIDHIKIKKNNKKM